MSIILNDNFKINVGNPIDSKYLASTNQPYSATTAVLAAIPESQRYVGLTVNVANVEYWFYQGVADGNFMVKDSGIAGTGITTANNGLTKSGNTVLLGGTLTGATVFTKSGTGSLLKYAASYSGEYDARTLPDAGFVTGLTSQSVTGATNGITKTGQGIKLGGTTPLSEATSICGAGFALSLGTAGNKVGAFQVNANSAAILTTGTTEICPTGALTLAGSAIAVNTVAAYNNSKAPFAALQIPDAQWVTGLTSGSLKSASNGLTVVGTDVKLGGILTENTTISGDSQILCIGIPTSTLCSFNVSACVATTNSVSAGGDSASVTTTAAGINSLSVYSGVQAGINIENGCILHKVTGANCEILVQGGTGFEGIQYAACYSTGFTSDCSLVDKGYVDSAAGAISASNGLTRVDDNITLGGTLTGTTTIDAAGNQFTVCGGNSSTYFATLEAAGDNVWFMNARPDTGDYLGAITEYGRDDGSCVELQASNPVAGGCGLVRIRNLNGDSCIQLIAKDSGGTANSFNMIPSFANTFTDGANSKGIEYATAYKANFTCHSLVDVDYVTGITSGGFSVATNGLTGVAPNVCLGGTLTVDTIINLNAGNCFRLCDNGNNTSYVFDLTGVTLNSRNSIFNIGNTGADYNMIHCSGRRVDLTSVSYTHLTLPTILLV